MPEAPRAGRNGRRGLSRQLAAEARLIGAFVAAMARTRRGLTHARHRTMLNVVLGESLEHKRLFDQAAAGSEDVIGRRTGGVARVGAVAADSLAGIGHSAAARSKSEDVIPRRHCAWKQSRRSRTVSADAIAALAPSIHNLACLHVSRHGTGRRRAAAAVSQRRSRGGDRSLRARALLDTLLADRGDRSDASGRFPARRGRWIWI